MTYRNSFIGGELTEWLDGLTTLEQYSVGCRELKNMIVTPYGGVKRRSGTWLDVEQTSVLYGDNSASKIIPFSFSSSDNDLMMIASSIDNSDKLKSNLYIRKKIPLNPYVLYKQPSTDYTFAYFNSQSKVIKSNLTDGLVHFEVYNETYFDGEYAIIKDDNILFIDTDGYFKFKHADNTLHKVNNINYISDNVIEIIDYSGAKTIVDGSVINKVLINNLKFESRVSTIILIDKDKFEEFSSKTTLDKFIKKSERNLNYWNVVQELPYKPAEVKTLKFKQSADVIFVTQENHPPAKISRVSKEPNTYKYDVLNLIGAYTEQNLEKDKLLTPVVKEWIDTTETYSLGDIVTPSGATATLEEIPSREFLRSEDVSDYHDTGGEDYDFSYIKYYYDIKIKTSVSLQVNDTVVATFNGKTITCKVNKSLGLNYYILAVNMWKIMKETYYLYEYSSNWIETFTSTDTIKTNSPVFYKMINEAGISAPITTTNPTTQPNTYWAVISTSVISSWLFLTSTWEEFTVDSVGKKYLISQELPESRYTFSRSASGSGDGSNTLQASDEFIVNDKIMLTTYGSWLGTVIVEISIDNGQTWEEVVTYINPAVAENYKEEIDLPNSTQFVRVRLMDDYRNIPGTDDMFEISIIPVDNRVDSELIVTEFIDSHKVKVRPTTILTNVDATYKWSNTEFSKERGYPRLVEIFENRLIFASTKSGYNTIWGSEVDNWYNFKLGSKETSPYSFKLPEQDEITYLKAKQKLFIGTGDGDWFMKGTKDGIISATNISLVKNSNRGSNGLVEFVNDMLFFVGRDGRSLYRYEYDYISDSFTSSDLTLLAKHIFEKNRIIDIKLQRRPYTILWCLLENGELAGLTFNKSNKVQAWHRHTFKDFTNESQISICLLSSLDEDILFLNSTKVGYYLNYKDYLQRVGNMINPTTYLDKSEILSHPGDGINGKMRCFLKDTFELSNHNTKYSDEEIANGFVEGVQFDSIITTTPISMQGQDGTGASSKKTIPSIYARVIESGNFLAGTKSIYGDSELTEYRTNEGYGTEEPYVGIDSGVFKVKLKDRWDRHKMVTVKSDSIYPLNLLYIETNDLRGE